MEAETETAAGKKVITSKSTDNDQEMTAAEVGKFWDESILLKITKFSYVFHSLLVKIFLLEKWSANSVKTSLFFVFKTKKNLQRMFA